MNLALNQTLNPAFNPYANELYFLTGAFMLQDLAVTAYSGAGSAVRSLFDVQALTTIYNVIYNNI